jgi:hypothetical protein
MFSPRHAPTFSGRSNEAKFRKRTVYRAPRRRASAVPAVDVGLSIDLYAAGQLEQQDLRVVQVRILDGSGRG